MKKTVSLLLGVSLSLSALSWKAPQNAASSDGNSTPVKIMAVGDSITDGYGISGSYRKYLYNELTKKGYSIDMVGSKGSDMKVDFTDSVTGESFSFDDDNTGYSGYAVREYPGRNGILETLKSTDCLAKSQPDIVILQIGTNDIIDNHDLSSSLESLDVLIEYILENISDSSALFVTTIPDVDPNRTEVRDWFGNYRHSADWQTQYSDDEAEMAIHEKLKAYNEGVLTAVKKRAEDISSGAEIISGDIFSVITDVKTQLNDGVHPNNTGYKLMGEYWAEQIDSYLSGQKSAEQNENKYSAANLTALQSYILGGKAEQSGEEQLTKFDLNNDKLIDVYDLVMLRKELLSSSSN